MSSYRVSLEHSGACTEDFKVGCSEFAHEDNVTVTFVFQGVGFVLLEISV